MLDITDHVVRDKPCTVVDSHSTVMVDSEDAEAGPGTTPHVGDDGVALQTLQAVVIARGEEEQFIRGAHWAIEDSMYPDELLEAWGTREEQALGTSASLSFGHLADERRAAGSGMGVPQAARGAVVYVATQVSEALRLPPGSEEQVVVMMDTYCRRRLILPDLGQIPAAVVAICYILYKKHTSADLVDTRLLLSAADWCALWLHEAGLAASAQTLTAMDLLVQEVDVLQALEWRTQVPTVHSWLTAFCARLDAATWGELKVPLDSILDQGISFARAAQQHISALDAPPRRVAVGVLCHGLVAARLLHVDMICPQKAAAEWEPLFADGTIDTDDQHPPSTNLQACMLDLLQLAADATAASLQQDSLSVARLVSYFPPEFLVPP